MNGILSKFLIRTDNSINASKARQKTTWPDERDPRVFYHLRPRARRVSIKMDAAQRQIAITVPGHARRLKDARAFADQKWDWIQVQLETLSPAQPFMDGAPVLFHGVPYTLVCPGPRGRPKIDHDRQLIIVPASPDTLAGRTKRFLIREAREALTQCTRVHAAGLNKSVAKVSIRDTRSRWGSCKKGSRGAGGEISYSWRLICAPPFVLDYVCAHECAHLVHADHSANYWALLNSMVETVKPAKQWLNEHGGRLHAVGAQA